MSTDPMARVTVELDHVELRDSFYGEDVVDFPTIRAAFNAWVAQDPLRRAWDVRDEDEIIYADVTDQGVNVELLRYDPDEEGYFLYGLPFIIMEKES